MVTMALQKAADLGAQALISTAPLPTAAAAAPSPRAAASGPAAVSSWSASAPRTMSRAASCSGIRPGRSSATPVNVEVVGQQDLSMSMPDVNGAHRARSGSPSGLFRGSRRYFVATPNGKSGQQSLTLVADDMSGSSMAVPSARHVNSSSVSAPSGGPAVTAWPPPIGHEALSPPHHARYGTVTPTRHHSMTPGGATPTAPMPPPFMQQPGCWSSAAAPAQRPGAPGPGPGLMPPTQPLSPGQWMPTDTSMMNVSGSSLLGPAGMPGPMPGPPGGLPGLPPAASFPPQGPGGAPGGPPLGNGAFPWPGPPMVGPPPGMALGGPVG